MCKSLGKITWFVAVVQFWIEIRTERSSNQLKLFPSAGGHLRVQKNVNFENVLVFWHKLKHLDVELQGSLLMFDICLPNL
jgi:hypothetical protein